MAAVQPAPAEPQADVWYLWPECVPYWDAWLGVQTQWRADMAGNMGLDYAGVRADLRAGLGLSGEQLSDYWRAIKACEVATLHAWAEIRKRGGVNGSGT